jgi:hypothetical protein
VPEPALLAKAKILLPDSGVEVGHFNTRKSADSQNPAFRADSLLALTLPLRIIVYGARKCADM